MKNSIKTTLMILFVLLLCSLIFTACDVFEKPHTHEFGAWSITRQPTCFSTGEKVRSCECGAKDTQNIDAVSHSVKVIKAKPSTCLETGLTEGKYCSVCNAVLVKQEKTPISEHDLEIHPAKAPTCEESGWNKYSTCKTVGCSYTTFEIIPASHKEVIDEAVSATCTESGLTEGKHCSACDTIIKKQEHVAPLEHKVVVDQAKSATCASTGLTEGSHCSTCGEVLKAQSVIEKKPHNMVTDNAKEPTCTESGLTEGKHCTNCTTATKKQNVISALGHLYNKKTNTCSRCGGKEYSEIVTRNDLSAYDGKSSVVIYLDKCVTPSNTSEYWTLTIQPDAKYVRLVGTPGVTYNMIFVVEDSRDSDFTLDLVDVTLKAIVDKPIINVKCKQTVTIGFYGEACNLLAKNGKNGSGGFDDLSTAGEDGTNGQNAISSLGAIKINVAADHVEIYGGNGGNGGNGINAYGPFNGGSAGDGGDGGYAISASSVDIYGKDGHSASEIVLKGGEGGAAGKPGKGFLWTDDGKKGKDGKSFVATSVSPSYH